MSSSDTPNEKEDDVEPDIYKTAGDQLPPGLLFQKNPIPGVTSLVSFFAAISYLYSTVKEHPGAFAFFFEKAYDKYAETQGFESGDHMTAFVGAEMLMKTYENQTNTTIPVDVKAGFQVSVGKAVNVIKPIKNAYTTSAALFGYEKTNQFVFTMIKTTYKTAESGAKFVERNGWRIESAYQFGMAAANQYIKQLTPFALEIGQEIFQKPEIAIISGMTGLVALKIYENPQILWEDLKRLQDQYTDFYDVLMGKYNEILATPKETKLKLYNVDPETKMLDEEDPQIKIKEDQFGRKVLDFDPYYGPQDPNRMVDRSGQPYKIREPLKDFAEYIGLTPTTNVIPGSVIPGSGIDGKKKGFISQKSVPQRTDEFRVFGNKLINIGYLDRNTVSLRTKGGWKIKGTPNKIVGGAVAGVLKAMVDNKQPSAEDVLKLNDDEKDYLNKLTAGANVDGFNVPTQKKTEEEKLKHEFEKTRGIIAAGNDNPDLIKQFKRMLVQLIHNKQLPKSQASDVLMELHLLGH